MTGAEQQPEHVIAEPSDPRSGGLPTVPAHKSTRKIVLSVLRVVLIVAVVAATVWQLWINWNVVLGTVTHMQWPRVVLAFIAILAGIYFSVLSWIAFVDELGPPIGIGRGAQISLVGSLGKYLPGSVWAYVLQIELGRQAGLSRTRVFAATVFNLAVIMVAALLAGSLAVFPLMAEHPALHWLPWLYLVLPVALLLLHPRILTAVANLGFRLLRRPIPDHPIRIRAVARSLAFAFLAYICYGVHLWLLADTWQGLTISPLALCIGTMGIAMIAGLVAFLLPSGIGVREFIIFTAISPLVGAGAATAYAAVSRLMFVGADLLTALVAVLIAVYVRRRRGSYHEEPGID
ncbi:lysylphosphatidylglycerol synthase transmembrane domain-containing protein [Humibacter antri]